MRNVAISWFQAGRESASQLARDSEVSPMLEFPFARERTVVVESPEKADKKSDEAGADDQMEVEIY